MRIVVQNRENETMTIFVNIHHSKCFFFNFRFVSLKATILT